MQDNNLKERVRKSIKEEIAISNIRKEFDMKTSKNRKIIYAISSVCAMFILGVGIFMGTDKLNNNNLFSNSLYTEKTEGNINIELNINKIKDMAVASLDADIKTIEISNMPEKFKFIEKVKVPDGYKLESSYNVFTRENINVEEYNILHDYVFEYRKDSMNNIIIAFSEIEKPLRDYEIAEGKNISKIGDVEIIISEWKQMYIATFEYKDIYFDIETTGITQEQLADLLKSIIDNI